MAEKRTCVICRGAGGRLRRLRRFRQAGAATPVLLCKTCCATTGYVWPEGAPPTNQRQSADSQPLGYMQERGAA